MALSAEKERHTFADCLTWGEDERVEIIDGEAVMMAPPATAHQVLTLSNGLLLPHEVYDHQGVAKVNVLDGCFIELSKVFPE